MSSIQDRMSELDIASVASDNTLSEVVGVYMKGKILQDILDTLHLPHSIIIWEEGIPKPHPNLKDILADNIPHIMKHWVADGIAKPQDLRRVGNECGNSLTHRLVRALVSSIRPLPIKLQELAEMVEEGAEDEVLQKKLSQTQADLNYGFKPYDYLLLRALHSPPDEVVSTDKQKTKEACLPLKAIYPAGCLDGMRVDATWKFDELFTGLCVKPTAERYTTILYRLWKVWFRGRLMVAVILKALGIDELTSEPVGDLVSLYERVTTAGDDAFMRNGVAFKNRSWDYDNFMLNAPTYRLVLPEGDGEAAQYLAHPLLSES